MRLPCAHTEHGHGYSCASYLYIPYRVSVCGFPSLGSVHCLGSEQYRFLLACVLTKYLCAPAGLCLWPLFLGLKPLAGVSTSLPSSWLYVHSRIYFHALQVSVCGFPSLGLNQRLVSGGGAGAGAGGGGGSWGVAGGELALPGICWSLTTAQLLNQLPLEMRLPLAPLDARNSQHGESFTQEVSIGVA